MDRVDLIESRDLWLIVVFREQRDRSENGMRPRSRRSGSSVASFRSAPRSAGATVAKLPTIVSSGDHNLPLRRRSARIERSEAGRAIGGTADDA